MKRLSFLFLAILVLSLSLVPSASADNSTKLVPAAPGWQDRVEQDYEREQLEAAQQEKQAERAMNKASAASTLPLCTSKEVADGLREAVQKGALSPAVHLELSAIKNAQEIGFDVQNEIRKCAATGFFNNGKHNFDYTIEWQDKDAEQYYIQMVQSY